MVSYEQSLSEDGKIDEKDTEWSLESQQENHFAQRVFLNAE